VVIDIPYDTGDSKHTPPEDAQDGPGCPRPSGAFEIPETRVKLRINQSDHNNSVDTESSIVEPNGRLRGKRMSHSILLSDGGRVKEEAGGNAIANKAEDIEGGKVDSKALSGTASPVQDGLRIKRK
jgi:hypothetical protein